MTHPAETHPTAVRMVYHLTETEYLEGQLLAARRARPTTAHRMVLLAGAVAAVGLALLPGLGPTAAITTALPVLGSLPPLRALPRTVIGIGMLVAVVPVALLALVWGGPESAVAVAIPLLFLGPMCIYWDRGMQQNYRHLYRTNPFVQAEHSLVADSDGLILHGPNADTALGWEGVSEVLEGRRVFVLLYGGVPMTLPKAGFRDPEQLTAFRRYAARATGHRFDASGATPQRSAGAPTTAPEWAGEYRVGLGEYRDTLIWISPRNSNPGQQRSTRVLGAIVVALVGFVIWRRGQAGMSDLAMLTFGLVMLSGRGGHLFSWLLAPLLYWATPQIRVPTRLEVHPEGILVRHPTMESFMEWRLFGQLEEVGRVLLLTVDKLALTIPKRAFSSTADRERFKALVRSGLDGPPHEMGPGVVAPPATPSVEAIPQ
ncbi:MAG TPA: YcxB family protein [bacterium]|nr:YcxB family protein [bacterium]